MKKVLLIFLCLLLVSCSTTNNTNNNQNTNNNTNNQIIDEEPEETYTSKFDGRILENNEPNDARIFAVMFDNSPKARPQAGLAKAKIVYEIRVEGLATRFMGIFEHTENVSVGGVRSARPYHVTLVSEYGAIYGHHGADQSVLNLIPQYGVENVSGMNYDGSTYKRQSHKVAPHNSYTTLDGLDERATQLGYSDTNHFVGFDFYESPQNISDTPATLVALDYGSVYQARYEYDQTTQTYTRHNGGVLHIDETTGESLSITNIIIHHNDYHIAANGVHKEFDLVSSGKAILISHGTQTELTWSKESLTGPTIYTRNDGQPLQLNPGQTWIQWIEESAPLTIE